MGCDALDGVCTAEGDDLEEVSGRKELCAAGSCPGRRSLTTVAVAVAGAGARGQNVERKSHPQEAGTATGRAWWRGGEQRKGTKGEYLIC